MLSLIRLFLKFMLPLERAILIGGLWLMVPFYAFALYFAPLRTLVTTATLAALVGVVLVAGVLTTAMMRGNGKFLADIDPKAVGADDEDGEGDGVPLPGWGPQ